MNGSIDTVIANNVHAVERIALEIRDVAERWGRLKSAAAKARYAARLGYLQQELQAAEELLAKVTNLRGRPELQDIQPAVMAKAAPRLARRRAI